MATENTETEKVVTIFGVMIIVVLVLVGVLLNPAPNTWGPPLFLLGGMIGGLMTTLGGIFWGMAGAERRRYERYERQRLFDGRFEFEQLKGDIDRHAKKQARQTEQRNRVAAADVASWVKELQ